MIKFGWIGIGIAAVLGGCGGGGEPDPGAPVARLEAVPVYHRMPQALDEPADVTSIADDAQRAPTQVNTPTELVGLSTKALTDAAVKSYQAEIKSAPSGAGGNVSPAATYTTSVVYSPAQIRAAYNLPPLPQSWVGLSAADATALGAGQTIYIVDAYHHPKMLADLNAFSAKFGLPSCTSVAVPVSSTSLPPASTTSCTVSVLYSTSTGGMTSTAPAYNASWAQEIALDTQWAHAIAPLARLVLIEAGSATLSDLRGSIVLANRFGSGVVSMSFAAAEGSWVTQAAYSSSLFSTAGMSYYAATGDRGTAVNWPAVASSVVGVGGTSLKYSSLGRTENVWSGSGGGISAYLAMPSYQSGLIVGGQALSLKNKRAVGDVAMDADPYTGVYVAFTAATSTVPSWYAFGGTSLATPMWAATVSVANALRAGNGWRTVGAPHASLYSTLSSGYSSVFYDITSGSNGTCSGCTATSLYDLPSGLGTPRANAVLNLLGSVY